MRHDDKAPDDEGRSGAEKGQIIILFAMFSTVLIGMLGLATDLGFAFAQKRTVQNAADAAAMAGARQVSKYKPTAPTAAYAEANEFATMGPNKMTATQSMPRCEYIDDSFKAPPDATLGIACGAIVPAAASGVHVRVTETHDTFFIRILPGAPQSLPIAAEASARVEVLRNIPKDAPFILCGSQAWAIEDKSGALINNGKGVTMDIFAPDGKINQDAVGYTFVLRDNNIGTGSGNKPNTLAGCDTPEGWKGLAESKGNVSAAVPGWFNYRPGTTVSTTFTPVGGVGGCKSPKFTNCVTYLPVAINTPSPTTAPTGKQIWVVGFAPFYLTGFGNNDQEIRARLVDNFIASGPSDAGWNRDISDKPVVIRMIQ